MLTLGIETSGRTGSVALREAGETLSEAVLSRTGRRHARTLVAEIQSMFQKLGRRPTETTFVAVSIGPGSFTGLRVGVVCAKTFAYVTGASVVAVDTLQAIAENAPLEESRIDVLVDAQREEFFYAQFERNSEGFWEQNSQTSLVSAEHFFHTRDSTVPVTGPGLQRYRDQISQIDCLASGRWDPQAAIVACLGERQATAGKTHDLWKLEPLYIRRSAAEEKADAQRR